MSAAPLPNGGLQLFYDAITDNAFPQDGFVWTRWQPSDQSPTAWTTWYQFQ